MRTGDRFYDGDDPQAKAVTIHLAGNRLQLRGAALEKPLSWPIAAASVLHWNTRADEITLRSPTMPAARLILGPSSSRAQLLAAAPHIRDWRRRRHRQTAAVIGTLIAGLFAVIIVLYLSLPYLAAGMVSLVPLQWDARLGDLIRTDQLSRSQRCGNPAGQQALDNLGARLLPANIAALPLTIDVIAGDDINAFAIPGNHVFIYAGLLNAAETPEMVAGVLAHEIGHLEKRHPTRGLIEQMGLRVVVHLLIGDHLAGDIGRVMTGLSYSRDMERQADERAVALLQRAHIRADGLGAFFALLKRQNAAQIPALLSDHPGLEARLSAAAQSSAGEPAMSPAAWQAVKAICGN